MRRRMQLPLPDEYGTPRTGRTAGLLLAAALCAVAAAALLATGCSSDDPSAVGADLVGAEIDVVLEPLAVNEIELYTALTVEDEGVPHWEQEVLYLGGELAAGEQDLFFIRAGYGQQQSGQTAGASVGLGVRYQRFDLSIAKRLSGSSLTGESEPVHISFGVVF